jgi:hypothetical protein
VKDGAQMPEGAIFRGLHRDLQLLSRASRFLFASLIALSPTMLTKIGAHTEQVAKQQLQRSPPFNSKNRLLAAPPTSDLVPEFLFSPVFAVHKTSLVTEHSFVAVNSNVSKWQPTYIPE